MQKREFYLNSGAWVKGEGRVSVAHLVQLLCHGARALSLEFSGGRCHGEGLLFGGDGVYRVHCGNLEGSRFLRIWKCVRAILRVWKPCSASVVQQIFSCSPLMVKYERREAT